ncbi:MAG TPA: hypothetical protein VEC12_14660 [Bacteroidia bacterium]|nr:hypothetical protein [Bacteroidia bacterium]
MGLVCFCTSIVVAGIIYQFFPDENLIYLIFIIIFSAGCIYFYLCFKSGYIIQDDGIEEYGHFIKRPFYKWDEIETVEVFYISNKPHHIVVSPLGAGDGEFGEPYEKLHLLYSKELYSLLLSKIKKGHEN